MKVSGILGLEPTDPDGTLEVPVSVTANEPLTPCLLRFRRLGHELVHRDTILVLDRSISRSLPSPAQVQRRRGRLRQVHPSPACMLVLDCIGCRW